MLTDFARDLGPQVSVEDAIRILVEDVKERRGLNIKLPSDAPQRIQAALLVAALLAAGCARETPRA